MTLGSYNPDKDIPSLQGKVIFITGATGGIGRETVLQLVKHSPSHIFFTGRNASAAQEIITLAASTDNQVSLTFLPCDPSSLAEVRTASALFLSQASRLDILIANLGILQEKPATTKDGYEAHWGINYMSNAAFLGAFLPLMMKTVDAEQGADVRFVALTSQGAMLHPRKGIDLTRVRDADAFAWSMPLGGAWARYGQSKLAAVLLAKEVARRYPRLTSFAIHPGVVETAFVTGMSLGSRAVTKASQVLKGGLIQPHQGAYNPLWAATSPDVLKRLAEDKEVAWYEPVGKAANGDPKCHDEKLAGELWEWTMKELKMEL
ncbi:short chain dehydrogenase domain-containing protein [Sarocladium implicatum]|nr:short chain dehydrogenase domain-containing protein [Sarocladium implicatum]